MLTFSVICTNIYSNPFIYCYYQWLLYVNIYAVLHLSTFVSINVICKASAVVLVSNLAINHIFYTNIYSIRFIFWWYHSLSYVNMSAVLVEFIVAINHCNMYKYMRYCLYILLLSIIVICTNICSIAGKYCSYQSLSHVEK